MNTKKTFILSFLLLAVMLLAGGCGGGGEKGYFRPDAKILFTEAEMLAKLNEVFGVFFAKDYKAYFDYCTQAVTSEPAQPGSHDMAIMNNGGVPFVPTRSFIGATKGAAGDYFAVSLTNGTNYSIVFTDPVGLGGNAVNFIPEVRVERADKTELDYGIQAISGDTGDAAIVFTFMPTTAGTHYIWVGNSEKDKVGEGYYFDVFQDDNKDGIPATFDTEIAKLKTALKIPATAEITLADIIYLRSVLHDLLYAGEGVGLRLQGAVDKWNERLAWLAEKWRRNDEEAPLPFPDAKIKAKASPAAFDPEIHTKLKPWLTDIKWVRKNNRFQLGNTLNALTGIYADKVNAPIENFTLPVPPNNRAVKTTTVIKYISQESQHESELTVGGGGSIGVSGITFDVTADYEQNIKYSEFNSTMVVKWDTKEVETRQLDRISDYKAKPVATTFFKNNGAEAFREKYGDYFVAGARYGASYTATLSVSTKSVEMLEKVKSTLNLSLMSDDPKAFQAKMNEMMSSSQKDSEERIEIEMRRFTVGGGWTPVSTSAKPQELIEDLNKFIDSVKTDNLAPIEVALLAYNQLDEFDDVGMTNYINYKVELFIKNQELARAYIALTGAVDTIRSIPNLDLRFRDGRAIAAELKVFETFNARYNNEHDQICKDINRIEDTIKTIDTMKNKYRDFLDRYGYFKRVIKHGKRLGTVFGRHAEDVKDTMYFGFKTYSISNAVNDDLKAMTQHTEKFAEGAKAAKSWEHDFKWDTGASGKRVAYVEIIPHWEQHSALDQAVPFPSIGKQAMNYRTRGIETRGVSWEVIAMALNIGDDANWTKYPFNWDDVK